MSPDLTIDSALSDPMIRAVMRADRIEPQALERLLRNTAKLIDRKPRRDEPLARPIFTPKPGLLTRGFCCA